MRSINPLQEIKTFEQMVHRPKSILSALGESTPEEVKDLLLRLLEFEPEKRITAK